MSERRNYKILSLDGGGVRGIISAKILQAIEKEAKKQTGDMYDAIIGIGSALLFGKLLLGAGMFKTTLSLAFSSLDVPLESVLRRVVPSLLVTGTLGIGTQYGAGHSHLRDVFAGFCRGVVSGFVPALFNLDGDVMDKILLGSILGLFQGFISGFIHYLTVSKEEHLAGHSAFQVVAKDLAAPTVTAPLVALLMGERGLYQSSILGAIGASCAFIIYRVLSFADPLLFERYSRAGIDEVLQRKFHTNFTINTKPRVLVTAFETVGYYFVLFGDEKGLISGSDWQTREVAAAATAAPTYFPPFERSDNGLLRKFVDGGILANNPALYGYLYARRHGYTDEEITIISIGTGEHKTGKYETRGGILEWVSFIVDVGLDTRPVHDQLEQLPGLTYRRIQVFLNKNVDLDDASTANITKLAAEADYWINGNQKIITEIVQLLEKKNN